jgi:hypothetical protein
VRVNPGSDPDRDDFGLPPVDIQIPDDARELDRDVQAYQRELRAVRRRERVSRLRGPLARDGMVLPLLAGCLILALVTSTLLIMFAADQTGMPEQPSQVTTKQPTASQPPGKIGGPLPSAQLVIGGKTLPLSNVTAARATMLTLVPPDCTCVAVLQQLGARAAQAHVAVYLVGTGAIMKQVSGLAAQAGQNPGRVAEDTSDVLGKTYGGSGMTAVLVRPDGTVASVVNDVVQPANLKQAEARLRKLGSATPAAVR